jgi:hypothetical protein
MFNLPCFHLTKVVVYTQSTPGHVGERQERSGQEAFESKGKEVLVEQSPAVSTADVMRSAVWARATAVSVAEKLEPVPLYQRGTR